LEHAFPDGHAGPVSIVLREAVAGMVELEVVDDSVWLPEMATAADGSTLGGALASSVPRHPGRRRFCVSPWETGPSRTRPDDVLSDSLFVHRDS